MATITPFVKRMRTQGGTIFTFSSALEDIGLNINERNNIVKMSHYALLNIPSIDTPTGIQQNKFNVYAIPGAFESFQESGSIKDGRVIVAENFQNYALNLETNLLAQTTYNPSLQTTISERVFWKWLKETGAIRWTKIDTSAGTYWEEETDTDTAAGYNSVVKCIGQISAGSVRTDTFGTYNETYILVPPSYGQTPVYFKQVEDDNYKHDIAIVNGAANILGRESYTKIHPDGLEYKAYYDLADSSTAAGSYGMQYDNSSGSWSASPGWWWTVENKPLGNDSCYFTDSSSYIISGIYNVDLRYGGVGVGFRRSKVDCLSIEYNLDNLKTIFGDSTLTFDKLAIEDSIDDTFDFNAVLIYYSVYNKALDKVLATNLLGILFLDAASGNTTAYPLSEILLPSITKLQSGPSGFGTSYSIRLNIKSDYMLDDTQAIVTDTTSSQLVVEDFAQVFDGLSKSLTILNQHTGTINYITEQYLDITSNQTNIENQIADLQYQVNDITRDITGTENVIAMFMAGDDPIGDSSIYMKNGKLGFFTNNPTYPAQFDVSVKVKDLIIENAIRDTSGNILLGYGSPLTIGSSTFSREINFYAGNSTPAFSIDLSNNVTIGGQVIGSGSITEASLGDSFYWDSGYLEASGTGGGGVSQTYIDGSLRNIRASYIPNVSLGSGFSWAGPLLTVNVSTSGTGISESQMKLYVDPSLTARDSAISTLNSSIGTAAFAKNASLGLYTTNASANTAFSAYATNASIGTAAFAKNASLSLYALASTLSTYAPLANPTFTGTPAAPTNATATNNTTQIATNEFVQSRAALIDTSVAFLNTRRGVNEASIGTLTSRLNTTDTSLNTLLGRHNITEASLNTINSSVGRLSVSSATYNTSIGYHDTSIKLLDSLKATKAMPVFTTSFGIGGWTFELSGNDLIMVYGGNTLFKFTTNGSINAFGEITAKVASIGE